jgi:hypothetical protein
MGLKGQCHQIYDFRFFFINHHHFKFYKTRKVVHYSRFTTRVFDTGENLTTGVVDVLAANLAPVPLTHAVTSFPRFDDTGGKFATIVNDTGENFAARVIDIGVPTISAN